ncbi:hypothetical protein AKJ41_06150 [candidate division MSBL1 archaeon SCGC-AAA259O05]|uniref:Uncharacterized protein n=1 Tax=candidate division MSBL1 archaeon SCGC-AAA259O05 TaxID=1698271 RepID=A0A133UXU4_9EURY|nr:hypothetical protein AKJ41_06150 [candidate division MSBL1 archaeon SCGC-AAA259O05]
MSEATFIRVTPPIIVKFANTNYALRQAFKLIKYSHKPYQLVAFVTNRIEEDAGQQWKIPRSGEAKVL